MRSFAFAGLAGTLILGSAAFGQSFSDRVDYLSQRSQQNRQTRDNSTRAQILGTLLYTNISVQFQETPARDAINYLRGRLGIPIIGRFNDDRTGEGIDPELEITLDIVDKPAITVLELVLDQCQDFEECTWQLRDGYLEVGTKGRLGSQSAMEIRYYPVRDLLFEPTRFDDPPTIDLDSALDQGNQNQGGGGGGGGGGFGGGGGGRGGGGGGGSGGSLFDPPGDDREIIPEADRAQDLIDLITEICEPDAWSINGGGDSSIRFYQGVLIVRAPDYVHRTIGGYPFAPRRVGGPRAMGNPGGRYVTMTTSLGSSEIVNIRRLGPFGGAAGGGNNNNNP